MTTDLPRAQLDSPNVRRNVVISVLVVSVLGWLLFALLLGMIIGPRAAQTADRLAYAAAWMLPIAILLLVMTLATGLGRFFGGGSDPTLNADSRYVDICRRSVTNTLEQSLIFALAALAMAAVTPAGQLGLLGSLVILFVLARLVFWFGYLRHPLYREAGMVLTYEINIVIIIWDIVHLI
jgi:uncharacterized MAPEG superfamily protein